MNVNISSTYRSAPMSDRKVRLVARAVKSKHGESALNSLSLMPHKSAAIVYKVLKSALANATQRGLDTSILYINEAFVDGGRMTRKIKPASKGRGHMVRKRTCHVTIKLGYKV